RELLQRLALDARHDAGNEPARPAHLDDGNQRAMRFEGGEASAQVFQLLHGVLHRFTSAPMDAISSPLPHSISVGGTLTRWNGTYPRCTGPAVLNGSQAQDGWRL